MSYDRPLKNIFLAAFDRYHLLGILRAFAIYTSPLMSLFHYVTLRPLAQNIVSVRHKGKRLTFDVASVDDLITVHEIFCRRDYSVPASAKVIVDFGSNIGISGVYFALNAPAAHVYLHEPDSRNIKLLRRNIGLIEGHFVVNEVAVTSNVNGEVNFGIVESGRYGGVGLESDRSVVVQGKTATSILEEIIHVHGVIDVLKIDVENLESEILDSLSRDLLTKIKKIYIEFPIDVRPEIPGFKKTHIGQVCCYDLI